LTAAQTQTGGGQLATIIGDMERGSPGKAFAADRYERILAGGSVLLLACVVVALGRGFAHWHQVSLPIWLHLATIMIALALTPVMLLRPRGDARHRTVGWIWCAAMVSTAVLSFLVRLSNHGGLSVIHILSVWVLIQVPLIVRSARAHDVRRHRRRVRAVVTGALLIAGFFTFPFGRLLGSWLFA
jgi:uncharacterized membrane protein